MDSNIKTKKDSYWRMNLRIVTSLMLVWFLFSSVLSIFLVEKLNEFKIGGFPLGFWIAQQGSIIVFIFLVLIYALLMSKIDREYSKQESKDEVSS